LRSKDKRFPVGPLARRFGGGGHDMAAGCTIEAADFAAVEKILLPELTGLLESLPVAGK
jgi:nanoRNase/pAp phosphatase (c-di-AMP/oligoRNAs hydrolase)